MVNPTAAVPTAPAAPNGSANKDARLLDKLAKLWAADNTRSIGVRQETGSLLNAHLGQPTKRQRHGRSVIKQAAERLQIAESELNRIGGLLTSARTTSPAGVRYLWRIVLGRSSRRSCPI